MAEPINEYTLENNTVFSIVGRGLKLNTADQVKEFVETIEQMPDLEVIQLSGNTIGVEASQALAEALKSKTKLKVKKKEKRNRMFLLFPITVLFLFIFFLESTFV